MMKRSAFSNLCSSRLAEASHGCTICFQLHSPPSDAIDNWQIQFLVASKQDPSLKLALADYWTMSQKTKTGVHKQFGKGFETNLLLNLGYAARMYPQLWQGLETQHPISLQLTLEEAFDFLKESAWVLEDAGFKIIVPAWYTPAGRRRAKIRLKAGGVGITLTKANHVFHFDRWWNPAVENQATDRAFRIDQKKNVFVHKFVAIGTLEERIDQMIEDKKKLSAAVVGADESWLTELDNDAFKQLIALNRSAILE
jgi:hypothetical protein